MTDNIGKNHPAGFYRTTPRDIFFIALVLAACVYLIVRDGGRQPGPGLVLVYHGSQLLKEVPLEKDETFAVLDGRMHVQVSQGKARILDSDCLQHICVHTGWIRRAGETIVCVPNRVLVEIKSRSPQLIDAVAF